MRFRLPIPAAWQDFEELCYRLWKEVWADPNTQKNGRAGQAQQGVDIYGTPRYQHSYAAVQCKDKDSALGSELSSGELDAECLKASTFVPRISSFTLATTAPRDAAIQLHARKLNGAKTHSFPVHVWSWDDIASEIASRPTLIEAFYKDFPYIEDSGTAKIAASNPADQFAAFFSRPALVNSLTNELRRDLQEVAYELCDNAFSHGSARHVQLMFNGTDFEIEDDGLEFNALKQLDASKASAKSHLGSLVLSTFQQTYGDSIQLSYRRIKTVGGTKNVLSFALDKDIAKNFDASESMDISVDFDHIFGRDGGESLAAYLKIPQHIKRLVLTITNSAPLSAVSAFLHHIVQRLPSDSMLIVSYAHGSSVAKLATFYYGPTIRFEARK